MYRWRFDEDTYRWVFEKLDIDRNEYKYLGAIDQDIIDMDGPDNPHLRAAILEKFGSLPPPLQQENQERQ